MKRNLKVLFITLLPMMAFSQKNLAVEGKASISIMEKSNTSDSIVVRLSDGTLAIRDAFTLVNSPWNLGKDTLGGIVYYIYLGSDGKDHGLIVSKTETTAQWQDSTSLTNADRSWDGMYNIGKIPDYPDINYSPAEKWIFDNFTTEWYLPSIDELSLLRHNRFHVNKALSDGGLILLSNTGLYWSSTEYNASWAWFLNFGTGVANAPAKTSTHSVRSIRAF